MVMPDFSAEFKRAIARAKLIDNGQVVPEEPKPIEIRKALTNYPLRAKLYTLVKIEDGIRTSVGFGMTEDEAYILARVLVKKLRKLKERDEDGGPLYEITQTEIEKEN